MEKYSLVDHGWRACVTANRNMVTKSQKVTKSTWFLRKKESQNEVLLCEEYRDVFVNVLKRIRRENGGKTSGQSTTYLTTEIRHFFSDFRRLKTLLATRSIDLIVDPSSWADPGFLLGGGALVSCSTSTPIKHIVFFFFAEYQLY